MNVQNSERFQSSKGNLIPVILVLVGLFIGGFFTYDLYYSSMEKSSNLEDVTREVEGYRKTLDSLNTLKQSVASDTAQADVVRYAGNYREDQILESIFAVSGSGVSIGSVSLNPGERLPSGISLASVGLSIQADSVARLNTFIDDLTGVYGKRRYLVKGLTFPMDTDASAPVSASVQLGLYYLK